MRSVGLHVRLTTSFLDVAAQAQRIQLPIFQCFFVGQTSHEYVTVSKEDQRIFLKEYRSSFKRIYIHGSYWINLSTVRKSSHRVFYRELEQAKRLECTDIILHPGAATGGRKREEGIDALAVTLNEICKTDLGVRLVLENGAHAGLSVGGSLEDFKLLSDKLTHPDQIFFCIDTAHAYSYGYDLRSAEKRQEFIQMLDTTMGLSRIVLIHLNDTTEKLGSRIDRHAIIGQGNIGQEALRAFVEDPRLAKKDIILELPIVDEEKELKALAMVQGW